MHGTWLPSLALENTLGEEVVETEDCGSHEVVEAKTFLERSGIFSSSGSPGMSQSH